MKQMMRRLFALLMAVMMLCGSLPLSALAEIAPSDPIEEHSQGAWMYSALGDVAPISLGDSMDDHIVEGTAGTEDPEFDQGYENTVVRVLINDEEYDESSVEPVHVDAEVKFTIKVTRITGNDDELSGGVTFSLNNGGENESIEPKTSREYKIVENAGEIDIGKVRTIDYTYTVQPEDVYVNATIDWSEGPIAISIPVEHEMNLVVEKSATDGPENGEAYQLGEEIPYTITVTNQSEVYVKNISVTDEKLRKTWTIDRLDGSITGEYNSETIEATYEVQEEDILAESVANTATATGSDPYEEDNVNGTDNETVPTVTGEPELTTAFNAEPDDGADLGDDITYTITVTNMGNLTVDEITASDTLNGDYDAIAPLDPKKYNEEKGGEISVTKVYEVTEEDILKGSIDTTATVTGTASNGDAMTPEEQKVTVTLAEQAPALTVVNSADKKSGAALGEKITYTITVTNDGNLTVNGITVTEPKTGLNETIASLAPGASETYTTTHTIDEADILAGSFVNAATATGTASNGAETTDSDEETVTPVAMNPTLTVTKTADKTSGAALNDVITYTITVKNAGNVTVSGITVTDPLTGLNQSVGTLAPGASAEAITTTYTVQEKDILTGKIENTATAKGTDPNGGEVAGSGNATVTTVEQAPALTVVKTANKTSGAALGEEITYTIVVTNSGNVTVSGITVTDPLTGLNQGAGTLAPGASTSVATKHTITAGDIAVGSFVNTATATGTDPNGGEVSKSDDETVTTVAAAPALTVVKTADKTSGAALGEEITYTITVTNSGNVNVSDITVTDPLTGLNQSVGALAPNASAEAITTTYTVQEKDILEGKVENTATATGKDPKGGDVTGSGNETVTTVEQAPVLTVEKKADKTEGVALGEEITYTITVKNDGNVTVSGITVTDPKTGFEESAGTLAPGASTSVTTKHTIAEADILAGSFVNTATATGTDPNGEEVTNSGSATVTTDAQAPALTVIKEADKTTGAELNDVITYTITVTNSGNVTVSDITVTDLLTGLEKSVGTLAPNASAEAITTTYTVQEKDILVGEVENTATAKGTDPKDGEVTGSGSATVTTVAQAPALTVEKTADKTSGAELNDVITYTITVTNSGNVTVSDITVSDPLTGLNETVESLAPGESKEYTTTHKIAEADILASSFVNTATAKGTDPNGDEVTGSDDETVSTVAQAPALTVTKEADKKTGAELNDVITYTITVTNSGNVTASDITVTDPLTGLNQSAGTLAPGASTEAITTTYTVQEKDILAGKVENTATATGTDPKGEEVTGSGNATVTTAEQAPALTVEKTANKTSGAALGEEITYTITVTNSGNVTVSGITVTDPLTGLEKSVGTLAPGASAEAITTTYTVQEKDILAGSFVNTATATGTDPNGEEVTGSDDETVTTAAQAPALTVVKTAGKTNGAALGEEITYTITVTNSGNVTVSDITVTDPLTGLEESAGTLAPGASTSVTTTHTIAEADILAGSFVNTATAKGTDPNGGEVSVSDDETVSTAAQAPALTVTKEADKKTGAELNDVITYTITVTNSGNVTVSDITVTDPLTGLEESAGTLAPNASTSVTTTHTIAEADILAGSFVNTATAKGTGPNGGEVTGSDDETVTMAAQAPALTVIKEADKTTGAELNDVITYTITVTNSGNVTVSDITVSDLLTGLNQNVGTLAPGEDASVTTKHTIAEADILEGSFVNTATATGTDPDGEEVTGSDDETVSTVDAAPALTVEKAANKTSGAALGEEITYTITVTNSGNVTVKDINVTDPKTGLNQSVGTLAPGEDASVTITHKITEEDIIAGSFVNTATAAGTDPDGEEVTGSGSATVTTVAQAPALTVMKTADKTEGTALDEEITYTITVTNSGNVTVSDITVTDPKTGLEKSAGTLAPGASTSVTTTHKITEEDILAGSFVNTATATGTDPNGEEVTGNDDETVTTAAQAPALTVEKTANKTSDAALGEEISYTIAVTNSGNVTVSDITVTDPLTGLEESAGTLAPGASTSVTTTHKITEEDILAGSFVNTATATGTDPNGGEVSGKDDATVTTAAQAPALTVEKTANKTSGAALGEEITYTITVTNSGNVTVSDIAVTDPKTGLEESAGTLTPNASTSVTTKHTITEADILAGSFVNTATAKGTDPNGEEVTGSDDETVTMAAQAPALTVEKKAGKTSGAALNEEISYTITVTNGGNVTVSGITVTDPKTGLEESVGTLAPNASTSVTTTHTITEADILEGSFVNTATAKGTDPNGGEVTGSDEETVTTAAQAPALTVMTSASKTSDEELGETITYTIKVTNSGNVTVKDITVTDPLTGLNQSVGTLTPGASAEAITTTYTVQEKDIIAGKIENTATATGTDPNGGEVTGSGSATVRTVGANPELTVEKSADKTSDADLNDVITYTITVTNSGNETVNYITVSDPLTGLEESVGTLAPGASADAITTTYTVQEKDILAGKIENTATAKGTDPKDEEVTGSDDATVTTAEQAPALAVEKKADKTSGAELNDVITYTITVTNGGNVTVSDITVSDPLTGLNQSVGALVPGASTSVTTKHTITEADILAGSFVNTATATGTDPDGEEVSGSGSATVTTAAQAPALTVVKTANKTSGAALGEEISYSITVTNSGNVTVSDITVTDPKTGLEESAGTLAPGASTSVTTTHTITEADILAGSFVNTATATGTDPNGGEVTGSGDEAVETVEQAPALTVEKKADKTSGAALGEEITYTITVTNSGNVTVRDITVTDPLTGLEEKSAGTLAPGASAEAITATYTVQEKDILAGSFVNTATATGKDPNGGEVTGSGNATVTTVEQAPALTAEKTADKASGANLGEEITYTITVTNSGNVTVSDITVTDPKTGLEESAGTLAPNASTSATTTHTITEADILAGSFVNTATATGKDPKGGEVADSDDETVTTAAQAPALTVEKKADKTSGADPNDVITYTITVTNSGNVTVSGITVTDPLTGLNQSVGTLAPNASTSVTTTHTITEADILVGSFVNTATATGTDPNGGEVTKSDDETVTTAAQAPALTVMTSASKTSNEELGETITYTIKVTNSGNVTVSDITVTDPLTGLEESVGTLAPGASAEAITTYTVTEADILAGSITNTATATGTDPNGGEVTGSGSATVRTVGANPELTVEKSADKTSDADLNDVITYTITVTNSGNETVNHITVTDPLTGLEKSVGTLAPGASADAITTTYTVQEKDILAGKIENTATATGTAPNGNEVTDSDDAAVETVEKSPAWTVEKAVSGATGADGKAVVGDVLTYTITIENTGNVTLANLKVMDTFSGKHGTRSAMDVTSDREGDAPTLENDILSGLAVGKTVAITYTYQVDPRDVKLENTASVQYGEGDPVTA